jgi:hypothetical protein
MDYEPGTAAYAAWAVVARLYKEKSAAASDRTCEAVGPKAVANAADNSS